MYAFELIQCAMRPLDPAQISDPTDADFNRSVSSSYYAVFHAACQNAADCLVGSSPQSRIDPAWRQAYRAVDHGHARRQCNNKMEMIRFLDTIQNFGSFFVDLYDLRHDAEYDPAIVFRYEEALAAAEGAKYAVESLFESPLADRRSFAVWMTMKHRT